MKTSTLILTKINGSHQETELIVEWDRMSRDDLITMAQRALIPVIQSHFIRDGSAPEKLFADAQLWKDVQKPKARALGKISDLPPHLLGAPDKEERVKKVTVDSIMDGLTDEDKRAIIALIGDGK